IFDKSLKEACRNLQKFLQRRKPREDADYWKARTLLYELNDVFHIDPAIKERAFTDGSVVYEEICRLDRTWNQIPILRDDRLAEDYRRLIREKVLFCSCRGDQ